MESKVIYRTRIAPSPTGDPHVGTLRNALYCYFIAKKTGGQFILRIEDTDKAREVEASHYRIDEALNWIGTIPDEGPFKQSDRLDIYHKYADQLIDQGDAYYCFCSSERLEKLRAEQAKNHQPPRYDRKCRSLNLVEAKERAKSEKYVVRMKMPDHLEIAFTDAVKGEVRFNSSEIDDQVIIKSDGYPTYHLASVVDDHDMKINLVMRSDEWLSSTPKHIVLYRYFSWDLPTFAHLPLILNTDRSKVSKRKNDTSILSYKLRGYHRLAMVHFLMFCGWNPEDGGQKTENGGRKTEDGNLLYDFEDYLDLFTLDRIGKSPAVFDLAKLNYLSRMYYGREKVTTLTTLFLDWLKYKGEMTEVEKSFYQLSKENLSAASAILEIVRMRADYFEQYAAVIATFFNQSQLAELKIEDLTQDGKISTSDATNALKIVKDGVKKIDSNWFNEKSAEKRAKQLNDHFRAMQPEGLSPAAFLHPTRVAITGERQSMNMFEYLAVYLLFKNGSDEIIHRLENAQKILA